MSFNPTKIEWADATWNPVTGCAHGCPYCYARRIAKRFEPRIDETPLETPSRAFESHGVMCYELDHAVKLSGNDGCATRSTPYPKGFSPTLHRHLMDEPEKTLTPARVFVGSMCDLFGDWVPDSWISEVFEACKRAPHHVYMFLSKNPQRYIDLAQAGKLPTEPNFWYGSTITGPDMPFFFWDKVNTFLSIEPLLEPFTAEGVGEENPLERVAWVIVGAMTGPGSKHHQPERSWVEAIVQKAREAGAPVFMKDSLKEVWGEGLMQEFPEIMKSLPGGPSPIPHCKECEHRVEEKQGKRGTAIRCAYRLYFEPKPVPGRYTRTSPPWCPKRRKQP